MREPQNPWPRRQPYYVYAALLLSVAFFGWQVHSWKVNTADPVQAFYLPAYIRTTLPEIPLYHRYDLLKYRGAWATVDDPGPFEVQKGVKANREALTTYLREDIFRGQSLWSLLWFQELLGAVFLVITVVGARHLESSRNTTAKHGTLLRGPKTVSIWRFNLSSWWRNSRGFHIETK